MEHLSEADLQCIVQGRCGGRDVLSTSIQPLECAGLHIFADFSALRVSTKTDSGEVDLSFILKTPPVEKSGDFVTKIRAFYKEPRVYNEILTNVVYQLAGKVGPNCFLARPEKFIVLDNLFDAGYKKLDVKREFNLNQCELVLNTLAKIHASSLVLEETKSLKIPELYPDVLFETIFSDETDHPGFDFMCTGINSLETLITTHFTHFPKSVINETMTMLRNLPFKLKPSVDFRNVLNHGGVWAENALFSQGTDGSPTEVLFVDFSNARYAPPACDVLIFLHLNTSRAFRELHQGALLTHYYNKLAKEVEKKGTDLREVLQWEEFEASCQHYLSTAIVAALMHIHVALLPEDILASVMKDSASLAEFLFEDRSERVLSAYSYDEVYRRRLSQTIVQALEYTQFRGRRRSSVYISA